MKIFYSFLFILLFSFIVKAQEPTPVVVNANTATEVVTTNTEFSLYSFYFLNDPSTDFDKARIVIVANIGIRNATDDADTGYKLFDSAGNQEIFNGTVLALKAELQSAVTNNVITNGQRNSFLNKIRQAYRDIFTIYADLSSYLTGNNRIVIKAKKVAK